eukprot:4612268-Pleurochrysis_carterae.AAC.1
MSRVSIGSTCPDASVKASGFEKMTPIRGTSAGAPPDTLILPRFERRKESRRSRRRESASAAACALGGAPGSSLSSQSDEFVSTAMRRSLARDRVRSAAGRLPSTAGSACMASNEAVHGASDVAARATVLAAPSWLSERSSSTSEGSAESSVHTSSIAPTVSWFAATSSARSLHFPERPPIESERKSWRAPASPSLLERSESSSRLHGEAPVACSSVKSGVRSAPRKAPRESERLESDAAVCRAAESTRTPSR